MNDYPSMMVVVNGATGKHVFLANNKTPLLIEPAGGDLGDEDVGP